MKTYIQIGANVGGDNFQHIIENLKEPASIHLIEPNSSLHSQLIENYKSLNWHNIHIHNFAISIGRDPMVLNFYNDSGLSSLINRKSYQNVSGGIEVNCKRFNDFCDEFNITEVEYMSIDTEGLDYEILHSIDINSVNIKEIVFEEWPYLEDDLNGNFKTGEIFLNDEVLPKYKNYTLSKLILDGMNSYTLKSTI